MLSWVNSSDISQCSVVNIGKCVCLSLVMLCETLSIGAAKNQYLTSLAALLYVCKPVKRVLNC